jgi:hypothetical protein
MEIDWSKVKIVWHSDVPNLPNVEDIIREDCKQGLHSLSKVSSLVFHHIFLSDNYEKDVITVWGEESDEDLHCDYDPEVTWSPITGDE